MRIILIVVITSLLGACSNPAAPAIGRVAGSVAGVILGVPGAAVGAVGGAIGSVANAEAAENSDRPDQQAETEDLPPEQPTE